MMHVLHCILELVNTDAAAAADDDDGDDDDVDDVAAEDVSC